jgi:hypothetical protein
MCQLIQGTSFTYQKGGKSVHINIFLETFTFELFSLRSKARLDASHHGPPHPVKDAGVAADSLKCLFVGNRGCVHKGFQVSPQVQIHGIQVWLAWRPCSGSSSSYPSVMKRVFENTWHSSAKMWPSTIMHAPHSCSDCQWQMFQ